MVDLAPVTLVSVEGESFTFPFLCMSLRFRRFSDVSMAGCKLVTPYTSESIRRLGKALSDPLPPIMTTEDASLLNYLELKDFRDAYKLYDHPDILRIAPCPLVEYAEQVGYRRVSKA